MAKGVIISARVSRKLAAAIRAKAKERQITRSQLLTHLVKQALWGDYDHDRRTLKLDPQFDPHRGFAADD